MYYYIIPEKKILNIPWTLILCPICTITHLIKIKDALEVHNILNSCILTESCNEFYHRQITSYLGKLMCATHITQLQSGRTYYSCSNGVHCAAECIIQHTYDSVICQTFRIIAKSASFWHRLPSLTLPGKWKYCITALKKLLR